MKKELYLILNIVGGLSLFLTGSCRSIDTENILSGSGSSAVSFNLLGSEFGDSGKLANQASLAKRNLSNYANSVQQHSVLLTPSSIITAELSPPSDVSKAPIQASLGTNFIAATPGNPITLGMKFRVIAYRSNGNYHTHQDYTVGQPAVPIMLDNGTAYNIVVYSYGTTSLPIISSGEKSNINSATVNYDDNTRDFMYQKIPFTPANYTNNTLNIKLRHKVAQITTILNSSSLGNITAITGGLLTPHYSNGVVSLSTGVMSGRSNVTSGAGLSFSGLNTTEVTAEPVFINSATSGSNTGGFSAAITIAGTTKAISFPNLFKITPENNSVLTINLRKCGAYIGPNTNSANYKEFMCQNLGATEGINPFSPEAGNHGAKYQWGATTGETGRYISQSDDQSIIGDIPGRNTTTKPLDSWSDTSKTANDPCPEGYRVPTNAQWQAVIANNNVERVGSWDNSLTNYSSALYFRNPSNIRTLMLPTAGYRNSSSSIGGRGSVGYYWSSTASNINALSFSSSSVSAGASGVLYHAMSVRCISQ
ncbi:hypothetical protein CMU59_18410 [Elizabethkingia anophelis]|nr:hypothetical protein [Elizabethkingia anophelis]MDV3601511.1 hypothetical protein [Elizabethkingia anophelis]MDV3608570.1 hypothetical protein [Elizabethkingia anophelis]MDV3640616.1 hypothetical protein [Elizabethkingia anophelis]MDV3651464.1 hypothetical protein [Elizabethkingia anophelis]